MPVRDTGIDILVSDARNRTAVSLQVKYSKDFLVTHMASEFQERLRACGWWTINREKLAKSPADYWVFVLQAFASRSTDFVVIPREELLRRLVAIHGTRKTMQSHIWATQENRCWETRGLTRAENLRVARGVFEDRKRDLSPWLNNWEPIARLNQ